MIKLKSIEFYNNGIRKLRNLKIDFADRITLIGGYNGIGKSTILGLIASASGTKNYKTYFKDKVFSTDINEIIHFDFNELEQNQLTLPWPSITYNDSTDNTDICKNIRITKRNKERLRTVPSNNSESSKKITGQDQKIPIPTIYLGMLRMLPIGESNEDDIDIMKESMEEEDIYVLKDFIDRVINGQILEGSTEITNQSIKNTKKTSIHPNYSYTCKSISLGQDSLSSIATAIASFNKVKREMKESYLGGLLVIDEIDAGFHPHAQYKIMEALESYARQLSLQIIATTHSPSLIEFAHPESTMRKNHQKTDDKVIYLADTTSPTLVDWNLIDIINDMGMRPIASLTTTKNIPLINIYLEDREASDFLKAILGMKNKFKVFYGYSQKKKIQVIPLGIGGSNLLKTPSYHNYFKTVLFVVDADTEIPKTVHNALKLPTDIPKANPERTIQSYLRELSKGNNCKYPETFNKLLEDRLTTDRICEEFNINQDISKRESAKKWFRTHYDNFIKYKIFDYWIKDHKKIVLSFANQLEEKLHNLTLK